MVSKFDIAYMKARQKLARELEISTLESERVKSMECYYLYKLDKNNRVYRIKELDQVFGWSKNRVDTQPASSNFKAWMESELDLIPIELGRKDMYETIYVHVLPLSHKIKYLTREMKLVIALIQSQDDDNFVIVSDTRIDSAKSDCIALDIWNWLSKATGIKSKTIEKLFRNELIDDLCKILEKQDQMLKALKENKLW